MVFVLKLIFEFMYHRVFVDLSNMKRRGQVIWVFQWLMPIFSKGVGSMSDYIYLYLIIIYETVFASMHNA